MNTTRLRHRLSLMVPFAYVAFLIFGLLGHLLRDDEVGVMILIVTVITWIMNKMIAETFNAVQMWRRLNEKDKR